MRMVTQFYAPSWMLTQELLFRATPFQLDALVWGGLVALLRRMEHWRERLLSIGRLLVVIGPPPFQASTFNYDAAWTTSPTVSLRLHRRRGQEAIEIPSGKLLKLKHCWPTITRMRLSFVVPAYNEEAYLPACLQSSLEQTRALAPELAGQTEIIVVNNASTDRTREVALSYPGVTVVDEPRKGLTFARQAGFAASSGDLICNVDSDSRLTPGWLQQVLDTFAEPVAPGKKALVALSGPVLYYDLTPRQRLLVHVFYLTAWMTYAINRYILRVGSMVQGGNFVTSRSALAQIGGFNTDISFYGEDTDIARRLNDVGEVRFTFELRMFSSARRLKSEGMLTMAARYSINYLWTTFFKRPFTDTYVDVREQDGLEVQTEG
jgi:glycosyltransferase involved in cell wall biosynthesis